MRKLFEETYPTIENKLIGFLRKQLKKGGIIDDRKAIAERLAHAVATRAYEECTREQCLKYGEGKADTPEECMRKGLEILIFIKAKNELANFFKPKSQKDPPVLALESIVATLPAETEPWNAGMTEDRLMIAAAFLPPEILKLFERVAQGISYEQLAKEYRTTVPAITQRIHRWRKKLKKYMNDL